MQIKKLNDKAVVPSKKLGNAGFDLAVLLNSIPSNDPNLLAAKGTEFYKLHPNETKTFGTGLSIYLQDPKLVGFILPRSKLGSKHGIVIANGTGVLDSSYQGELMIALHNRSNEPFFIEDGMLVAQLVVCKMPLVTHFTEVEEFTEGTERGSQGINCDDLRVKQGNPEDWVWCNDGVSV